MYGISLQRRIRMTLHFAALAMVIALLSACGSGQDKTASAAVSTQPPPARSIQKCLARHGAKQARTVDDLSVLAKAEEEDDVSKPGFAFDKVASVIVDVWTGSSFEGRPAPWMFWIGHPFGESLTPEEIVADKPPKSYVMFTTSARKTRSAQRCIGFSGKGHGKSHN